MLNNEEYFENKLEIITELLLFSRKQEEAIMDKDWDKVTALVDSRQGVIDRLIGLDDENPGFTQNIPEKESHIYSNFILTMDKLITLDKKNAEDIQNALKKMALEISENDEKIKVATAYQPTLGEEKNKSNKLNTKN